MTDDELKKKAVEYVQAYADLRTRKQELNEAERDHESARLYADRLITEMKSTCGPNLRRRLILIGGGTMSPTVVEVTEQSVTIVSQVLS